MHDRIAELAGLRVELAHCTVYATDRAEQVETQISRVRAELDAAATGFEEQAQRLGEAGQDVPAAQAAVAARDIRAALDKDEPAAVARRGTGAKQTATAAPAPETTGGGS